MPPKKSKYNAKKINYLDMIFDSKKEFRRYLELRSMEDDGLIHDLERQKKFVLIPSQRRDGKVVEYPCTYIADFCYTDADGRYVVEDTKGVRTSDYIIKRKLMLFIHDIKVHEI